MQWQSPSIAHPTLKPTIFIFEKCCSRDMEVRRQALASNKRFHRSTDHQIQRWHGTDSVRHVFQTKHLDGLTCLYHTSALDSIHTYQ